MDIRYVCVFSYLSSLLAEQLFSLQAKQQPFWTVESLSGTQQENKMPYTDLKCRILEEELQTFWPDWHVVRQISEGSFADVFEIRRNEFGVEFAAALKVIRHKDEDIELQTVEILDSFEKSFGENRSPGTDRKISSNNSANNNDTGKSENHAGDDSMPEIFRNEIRILEQLRGAPNVVNMEGLHYRKDGREHVLYIRMELLTSIKDLLQTDRAFSVQEIIRIGKDICAALTCCEDRHIIHRDIKPGNLFLDKYGTCKVGDFGVSKKMETVHLAHTMTGIGTISYMAPEIYRRRPYNNTVDIYALGLVLYQLLNRGRMPFMPSFPEDYTTADIDDSNYHRLHGREIPSLLDTQGNLLRQENAEELDQIIRKACAYQPQDRYQTAKEMAEALENCTLHRTVPEPAKVSSHAEKATEKAVEKDLAKDVTPAAKKPSSGSMVLPAGKEKPGMEQSDETNLIIGDKTNLSIDERRTSEQLSGQDVQEKKEGVREKEKKKAAVDNPDHIVRGLNAEAAAVNNKTSEQAEKKLRLAESGNVSSGYHRKNKSHPMDMPILMALVIMVVIIVVVASLNENAEKSVVGDEVSVDQEETGVAKNEGTAYDSSEWENVIRASEDGTYDDQYDIGDTIPLDLGEEGTVTMVLVAKDVDELADGNGTAHMTWISEEILPTERRMNPAYDFEKEGTGSQGGWEKSELRTYLAESIQPLLPEELQGALKEVRKYSRVYNTETDRREDQETLDKIWIPSYREVFGEDGTWGNENKGVIYHKFVKDIESRKKGRTGASSASWWWLRSTDYSLGFSAVSYYGSSNYYHANLEGGVVVGFCL